MTHGRSARGFHRGDLTALLQPLDPGLVDDLHHWLDVPDALPIQECVASLGGRLDPVPSVEPNHGLTVSAVDGRTVIRRVARGSAGRTAALVPGDELIAIDGRRVHEPSDLPLLLQTGKLARITYARRRCLAETRLIPDEGVDRFSLSWDPGASSEQRALRDQWFRFL